MPPSAVRSVAAFSALALALSASPALAWRSALYPADWTPATRDGSGRFLHDFSYAGYHAGEDPIPTLGGTIFDVTAMGADPTGVADSTAAIQSALDMAADAGGGVVLLPAGTYRVEVPAGQNVALWMHGQNVVLRGAGPAQTRIVNHTTNMRDKKVLWIGPRRDYYAWEWGPRDARPLAEDASPPSRTVRVGDVSGYAVGDDVFVRIDASAAWVAEHGMTGTWSAADTSGPTILRRIVSIDAASGTVELDGPLRHAMRTRDGARLEHPELPLVREVGVESLAIGNLQNRTSGTGDDDYSRAGTGGYEMHASFWIYVNHATDAWIRDVSSFRPTQNTGDFHFLSNAIRIDYARRVTLQNVHLARPQYKGEGGNGYLFTMTANDCLLRDSSASFGRHNVSFSFAHSSGNVVLRTTIRDSRLPADFHQRFAAANLLDNVTIERDTIELAFRDCCGHGHGTSESVVWNAEGLAYDPPGFLEPAKIVDSQQWGNGYVVGTRGPAPDVLIRGGDGTEPLDLLEGKGMGATLEPASLYEDQLSRRLGIPIPENDAGTPDPDGGVVVPDTDGGVVIPGPDGSVVIPGPDGSVLLPDGAIAPGVDAGTRDRVIEGGCCAVAGTRSPSPSGLLAIGAIALAFAARRRRS